PPSCNVPGIGFIILDRLSLTEYQHIECQWGSENPIYEGRKIVELDLRRAQTRQKFANSSRIHEDVAAVETISVALPRSFVSDLSFSSLCLRSVIKKESSEEA